MRWNTEYASIGGYLLCWYLNVTWLSMFDFGSWLPIQGLLLSINAHCSFFCVAIKKVNFEVDPCLFFVLLLQILFITIKWRHNYFFLVNAEHSIIHPENVYGIGFGSVSTRLYCYLKLIIDGRNRSATWCKMRFFSWKRMFWALLCLYTIAVFLFCFVFYLSCLVLLWVDLWYIYANVKFNSLFLIFLIYYNQFFCRPHLNVLRNGSKSFKRKVVIYILIFP